MLRIYIVTDMEGVCGVLNHDDWVMPAGKHYEEGKRLLTLETNAAAAGFFAAGADEISVLDGHGAGGILPDLLDSRLALIRGGGYPFGLEPGFTAMAWVGQHAKAGTVRAHIPHTGWFNVIDYSINGVSVGEFGQMALLGAEMGVRSIFAAGDTALCREAEALIPGIVTASVKTGSQTDDGADLDTDRYRNHNLACIHLDPAEARTLIAAGAKKALENLNEGKSAFPLINIHGPYRKDVSYRNNGNRPAYTTHTENCGSILELLLAK
jgi:D-amino peptidase